MDDTLTTEEVKSTADQLKILKCVVPECQWRYECIFGPQESMELLKMHMDHAHKQPMQAASAGQAVKFIPPSIDLGVDQEAWMTFTLRWQQYCKGSGISRELQPLQLLQCASESLGTLLLQAEPRITSFPPEVVLEELRKLAVIPTAKSVARADLMRMIQANDEPFRNFSARVQGKAQICGFSTKRSCQCGIELSIDYTSEVIKDVIVAGIHDESVRTSILETDKIEERSVNEIISLVERKEKARKAYASSSVLAVSSFKRQNNSQKTAVPPESKKTPCPRCKKLYRRFTGKNLRAYEYCLNCFRAGRTQRKAIASIDAADDGNSQEIALIQGNYSTLGCINAAVKENDSINAVCHRNRDHPRITLSVTPEGSETSVSIVGIADTGAQSNVLGYNTFIACGFDVSLLENVSLDVYAANRQPLNIIGGFNAKVECVVQKQTLSCNVMIYVSKSVMGFFVSFDTLIRLQIIDSRFPKVSCSHSRVTETPSTCNEISLADALSTHQGCCSNSSGDNHCDCPQRSAVPLRPTSLPFAPVPENINRMKEWLLNYFNSSTFNTCPHQPLQQMSGPPIEIHLSDTAVPRVCHKPAPIPLHWQKQVEDDIKRDEALGILEKVPYGVPVEWCHRLVVTRKHDGSPRRTVDLSPLNKYCKRETHGAESPYNLARRIPSGNWKTVTDAWNGYHSVPLRKSDRHLTTFITPLGRWRYTRAPQGFLSSGDGYNRRFAAVLEDFPRKERCVDDTIHFDSDLEEHWWRTIDLLIKVGHAGIVLNPKKFQFCSMDVEFAGFKITSNKVQPLSKYLKAIQLFPKPTSVTDIKSWFGLVNQVATYAQLRELMAPFRPFLSPKTQFSWDAKLDASFEESKGRIVDLIKHGVQIFDIDRWTCLRPDWSRNGVGYFLLQKHCTCEDITPSCCSNGWKITVAGSRFLSDTESRYAAVEGEALAIVWGLEQTKYFTQGCEKLLVVTDHKPLVRVFGDRTLDEITNTRLFRLKQRTLQWNFKIQYQPGRTNLAADAASRHPVPDIGINALSHGDISECLTVAAICQEAADVTSISWDCITKETAKDPVLTELRRAIDEQFVNTYSLISDYMRYKNSLFIQEDAIMYQDRVVIPQALRKIVLDTLHAAHQGASSMQLRAQAIVFWPGMTRDILMKRAACEDCNRNAPSQAALPSEPSLPPSLPFQQIVVDFFDFGGRHYLVAADRLSGFSEVFMTPSGTSHAGARGLVACLRKWFETFGVPEQVSSDGGPEFIADHTQAFLKSWGVTHRMSSAYNPQSNGRAEVAVKTVKRLMRSNTGVSGSLNTDRFLRAMLQLRNTPDPDCGISPSEIVFGRQLRDNLSFASYNKRSTYSRRWQEAWEGKENALRARFVKTAEKLNQHSRDLPPLVPGSKCFIQSQTGNSKNQWRCTGVVIEAQPHDKYVVKVDGTGRITTRNR
ncbi:MAG: DDE-type integrase/transposase/recombinase, partial [Bacteroidota bacterium]